MHETPIDELSALCRFVPCSRKIFLAGVPVFARKPDQVIVAAVICS
jgi:hypothetical protein